MRLKRLLVALVALVVVVLGAAVGLVAVVVLTVDPNDYRAEISKELERVTGRKVNLGGELELSPSLTPSIVAHDVTLANAAWGSQPDAATFEELAVEVALMPLLDGDLHVLSIRIDGATIFLETSKEGERSWVLDSAGDAGAHSADGTAFRLDGITITDSTVVYLDGATGIRRQLDIAEIDLQADGPMSPASIDAQVTLDGMPVDIQGTLDSFGSLRAGRDSRIDLTVRATNVDLTAKGTLGGTDGETPFDLAVALEIASLGLLDTLGVVDLPVEGPLSLSGHVSGGMQTLTIDDLVLAAAGTRVTGTLTGDFTGARPSLGGSLAADTVDLATWTGEGGGDDDRIFPTDLMPLHLLTLADAHLTLAIGSLVAGDLTFSDVAGTVKLAGGKLAIDPLSARIDKSKVDGTFKADATVSPAAVALTLASPSLDAGALLAQTGATDAITGNADLKIDVSGTGESVAALMATLDGTASVVMTEGSIDQRGLDLFLGGATALIGGLFAENTDRAQLSCLAAAWDIERGIATQKVLLIDTQYSTLTGKGTIDLGKETIDETLTPNAKGVSLNLAVPVRIHGPLADPSVTPDEGAMAMKLGSLIGSVFFPPALLLGLGDIGLGADHPCLAANAPGGSGGGFSTGTVIDGAGKAVEGAAGAAKGVLDDIGEGLDNLFGD